jgi:hypothetical protein
MGSEVVFRVGQLVTWPAAGGGVAQVDSLLRRRVRIYYPTKAGNPRFATVAAEVLANACQEQPLLFDVQNPFFRGVLPNPKSRRYQVGRESSHQATQATTEDDCGSK